MVSPRTTRHPVDRRKAYVETYGCQMNISDGELMEGILSAGGYDIVTSPEQADVVLVNTCAIREHAEQRVIGRVGQLNSLKRDRPDLLLGVTGCMAQRLGEKLLEDAPYVDLVMGPDGYRRLPEVLRRLRPDGAREGADEDASAPGALDGAGAGGAGGAAGSLDGAAVEVEAPGTGAARTSSAGTRGELPVLGVVDASGRAPGDAPIDSPSHAGYGADGDRMAVLDFAAHENYEGLEIRRRSGVTAWVPVQRGCDHRCTYCIVPYVRGPEKNREPEHILAEVRGVVAQGIHEVTLLGQTVNSYRSGDWDFPRLLRAVARVPGIRRVRYTSPHPNDVTAELAEVMAEEETVCKQLHLPAQSGHDRTLKRMLRRYTVESFLEKVELVRRIVPGIALSTDIIVAFPGETDEEYEATLELMRRVRFDDAYLYKYSPRDGTPATRLPQDDFLPEHVAQERLERLIALHRGIQAEINRAEVGRTVEVLVEKGARSDGDMLGRTDSNKVVAFPGGRELVGRFMDVRITGTTGATFRGERVRQEVRSQVALA